MYMYMYMCMLRPCNVHNCDNVGPWKLWPRCLSGFSSTIAGLSAVYKQIQASGMIDIRLAAALDKGVSPDT